MGNYSKKAVEVDAFRFGTDPFPDWFNGAIGDGTVSIYTRSGAQEELRRMFCTIRGQKRAECGDYIIRGVKGEIYSVEYDEFIQGYEPHPMTVSTASGLSTKRLQPAAEERPFHSPDSGERPVLEVA